MNYTLEKSWKEAVIAEKKYPGICMVADRRLPGQDSNRRPLEYKSKMFPLLQPTQCVNKTKLAKKEVVIC
jgi:hypothetical protein